MNGRRDTCELTRKCLLALGTALFLSGFVLPTSAYLIYYSTFISMESNLLFLMYINEKKSKFLYV